MSGGASWIERLFERKGSKRILEPLWSLHIGIFWEIHFINLPEVQGQVVGLLIYGKDSNDAKVSKSSIRVNNKIAQISKPRNFPTLFHKWIAYQTF